MSVSRVCVWEGKRRWWQKQARSIPDVGGDVAAGIAHFVRTCRPVRFVLEREMKVLVERHATVFAVAVDLHQIRSFLLHRRIELIVPRRVERIRHVQTSAVQRQLNHLRTAGQRATIGEIVRRPDQTAEPDLTG